MAMLDRNVFLCSSISERATSSSRQSWRGAWSGKRIASKLRRKMRGEVEGYDMYGRMNWSGFYARGYCIYTKYCFIYLLLSHSFSSSSFPQHSNISSHYCVNRLPFSPGAKTWSFAALWRSSSPSISRTRRRSVLISSSSWDTGCMNIREHMYHKSHTHLHAH